MNPEWLMGRSDRREPENEIGFDDFTYALHREAQALTEENRNKLLEMAPSSVPRSRRTGTNKRREPLLSRCTGTFVSRASVCFRTIGFTDAATLEMGGEYAIFPGLFTIFGSVPVPGGAGP